MPEVSTNEWSIYWGSLRYVLGISTDFEKVSGVVYRENGEIISKPNTNRIKELDLIPYPAWDLLPIENYLKEGLGTISAKGKRIMPLVASRGCPYACKFCSNEVMWGKGYVMRNPQDIIDELKFYIEKYNITSFELQDLTFITKKRWVIDFCKLLTEEDLGLDWNIPTTRSEAITEEVVSFIKKTNCTNLCLTPDTGSNFQIKDMNKRVKLDRVTKPVKILLANEITLKVNLVIGFPNEKHIHVWLTILYGMKLAFLGVNSVIFYRFVPYPGSIYFESLQKEKRIPQLGPDFDKFLSTNTYNELFEVYSFSKHISSIAIAIYLYAAYILVTMAFISTHPFEFIKMLGRVSKGKAESQIETLMIAVLRAVKRKLRRLSPKVPVIE
jgi:anaerobic magnesium-protoporphyrin IX monomethyl ester cyclase